MKSSQRNFIRDDILVKDLVVICRVLKDKEFRALPEVAFYVVAGSTWLEPREPGRGIQWRISIK
jgi:hypothetical protein